MRLGLEIVLGVGWRTWDAFHPFSRTLFSQQPKSSWRNCGWEWPVFNPDGAPQYGTPKERGNSHSSSLLSKPTYFPFRILWGKKGRSACLRDFKEHSVLILQISDYFTGLLRLWAERGQRSHQTKELQGVWSRLLLKDPVSGGFLHVGNRTWHSKHFHSQRCSAHSQK